jgi:signal recognition particle subunit SRP19
MRKQEKVILWPTYFDSLRTRGEGRRMPKNLAVPSPRIAEMKDAADKGHLDCELIVDAAFPRTPWSKSGMILVRKKQSKEEIIREIAKQLMKIRNMPITK